MCLGGRLSIAFSFGCRCNRLWFDLTRLAETAVEKGVGGRNTGCFALAVLRDLDQHGERGLGVCSCELFERQLLRDRRFIPAPDGTAGAGPFAAATRRLISV